MPTTMRNALALLACVISSALPVCSQTAGLGIHPGRIEVEMQPGTQKTVSFEIEAPPSDQPVRGRLLLSLTDWELNKDGSLAFFPAASRVASAAPWIEYTPSALSISSGRKELVRVTITLPPDTKAGEYRAGLFVQERPPATPPSLGEHTVVFRFRHFVALYVMVPPVAPQPLFTSVSLEQYADGVRLLCAMKNKGALHVRPQLSWSLRNQKGDEITATKRYEATVLLPFAELDESFQLEPLAPGRYEITASVDFHDRGPVQTMTRIVDIAEPVPGPGSRPIIAAAK